MTLATDYPGWLVNLLVLLYYSPFYPAIGVTTWTVAVAAFESRPKNMKHLSAVSAGLWVAGVLAFWLVLKPLLSS